MTLTILEVTRIVIKRLKISESLKVEWLLRRAIKPGRIYTKREFRAVRRAVMPFINTCVAEVSAFITNGGIARAEEDYYNRTGEAPVDIVINIVKHTIDHNSMNNAAAATPPPLWRTCTGYFGPSSTPEEVAFQDWEA